MPRAGSMSMNRPAYEGKCHCGAIGFHYATNVMPAEWSIRACQCRFCLAHDALSTSDRTGSIAFVSTDSGRLQRYRFGLKTADFLLCTNCGVYIGAVIEIDTDRFGIVNTHAMAPAPENIAAMAPICYDGEKTGERVSRRAMRWTPVTSVPW